MESIKESLTPQMIDDFVEIIKAIIRNERQYSDCADSIRLYDLISDFKEKYCVR